MADAEPQTFRRSSRDPEVLQRRLRDWAVTRLPEGSDPDVSDSDVSVNSGAAPTGSLTPNCR